MMDANARLLVFLPLVGQDERGEPVGRLARSWEHSADYREWTFHLRTDVQWHDGVPATAEDVKFTVDLWSHPDINWYGAAASTEALNDSTVVVRYLDPTDALRYLPWLVYYPKHLLENEDPKQFHDWEFWREPVGNGPYRFVRLVPATIMEFEANPDFYAGKPEIEHVVLKFVADAGQTELVSGGVDVLTDPKLEQVLQFQSNSRFQLLYSFVSNVGLAIYWNHASPLFRDSRVRRALTLAVDRHELLGTLGFPVSTPIVDGPFTEQQLRRSGLSEAAVSKDTAEAVHLLDTAGWRDRDGDGLRDRDGLAFRFTVLVGGQPYNRQVAVYVQQQLRRLGIQMNILPLEGSVVYQRVNAGDFDAAVGLMGLPADWLSRYFGAGSLLGYRNADVAGLVDDIEATADPGIRDRLVTELRAIFSDEVPALFLFPSVRFVIAHRRLRGLASPWKAEPTRFMDELWLAEERHQ
ncbi:MAG: ABC transporter substrate-binding protein [Gemmatimonadales bacterium]|jgi:peptide/nickel transport system substrate-binding protein